LSPPDPLRVLDDPPLEGHFYPRGGGIRLWESSRFSIGIPTRISRSPGGPLGKSEFFGQISIKSTEIDEIWTPKQGVFSLIMGWIREFCPNSLSNAC